MELDVYTEALKLAFEYQGEQHFKPVYWSGTDFATQVIRDEEKRRACKRVLHFVHNSKGSSSTSR